MQSEDHKAKVILLNGVGSVGKGSIARALQQITAGPFLHVEMDAFFAMLPLRWREDPSALEFAADPDDPGAVAVRTGPHGHRVWAGMRHAAAALADQGNNLIIDDVIIDDDKPGTILAEYRRLLRGHDLHVVGVFGSLETIEARERARGDRRIGLARWQIGRVHQGCRYDLEIQTDDRTPEDCARQIKAAFGL